jgi:DnaJ-domain-containing protein 1
VWSWINARNNDTSYRDEAWEELETYLRGEPDDQPRDRQRNGGHGGPGERNAMDPPFPTDIRQALYDLELKPGASREQIRSAYRRLLLKYHPDRFHTDAERAQTAQEITQRISLAYKRLNDYYT